MMDDQNVSSTPVLRQDSTDGFDDLLRQESDWDATDFSAFASTTEHGTASPTGQMAPSQPLAPSSAWLCHAGVS